jgi:ADP-ribose pyrophosphatase YjhB (NUDIX family)
MRNHKASARPLSVGIGLVADTDRVLLRKRLDPEIAEYHDKWELPGGKIEPGENVEAAIEREVREETGHSVRCRSLLPFSVVRSTPGGVHVIVLAAWCELEDAESVRPTGDDADVEHRWFPFSEIPFDAVIPGSREFLIWWLTNEKHVQPPPAAQEYRLTLGCSRTAIRREMTVAYEPNARRPFKLIELVRPRNLPPRCREYAHLADAIRTLDRHARALLRRGYTLTSIQPNHPLRSQLELCASNLSDSPNDAPSARQLPLFPTTAGHT